MAYVPAAHRRYRLWGRYRLTEQDYENLWLRQAGMCLICEAKEYLPDTARPLAVDHDRRCCPGRNSCGKCVRGLLCFACNQLIGLAKDSANRLTKAAAYVDAA